MYIIKYAFNNVGKLAIFVCLAKLNIYITLDNFNINCNVIYYIKYNNNYITYHFYTNINNCSL